MSFGLRRGLKRGYRASHLEIQQLHATRENVMDLPETFEQETVEEYRKRVNTEYRALQNVISFWSSKLRTIILPRVFFH